MPFPYRNVVDAKTNIIIDDTNTQKNIRNRNLKAEIGIPPYDQFSISLGRAPYVTFGASITVEASLVMPLIIFAVVSLIQIMIFMNVQLIVQSALYHQTMKASGYSFAAETVLECLPDEFSDDEHAVMMGIIKNGVTELLIKHMVLNELGDEFFDKPWINGGKDGVQVIFSCDADSNSIDVMLHYELRLIYNMFGIRNVPIVARAYVNKWTGVTQIQSNDNDESADGEKVYMTKGGTVYHLYRDCTYLSVKLTGVAYTEVNNRRNASGGKYYPCSTCCKGQAVQNKVFISKYGECYHTDISCRTIYHNILEVSKTDAENRRLCSKCRERNGGEK